MKKHKRAILYLCNIAIPMLLGFLLYYIFSPDVLFVRLLDFWLGNGFHLKIPDTESFFLRLIRNHLQDFLWAYALTFSIFILMGSSTAATMQLIFWIAFCFSAFLEILQCTSLVPGTFDVFDIFAEFLGILSAVFIIRITNKIQSEEDFLYER